MSDEWPRPAPDVRKAFKEAHDGKEKRTLPPNSDGTVSKPEIEKLEKQIKTTAPQPRPTPPGGSAARNEDAERAARLEKMRQKLKRNEGLARNDFGRSM